MSTGGEMQSARDAVGDALRKTTVHPGGSLLRRAVRMNIVSFPAQVPVLLRQPAADVQWRMVLLYFVRGWSQPALAARFGIPIHRISKAINDWSIRALALGYVQVIDAKAFAVCCGVEGEEPTYFEAPQPRLAEVRALPAPLGGSPIDVLVALDIAIARCEEGHDEFWMKAATLLGDLRTAASAKLRQRDEERVSHAVA
ncbi:MAG TPA: hypothetical protein VN893_00470 [Bryobacteraceae bacterium]|nr:hypothetical protein [Bryobacteraceae bacterium]